jgi:hypothetical protein
MALSSSLKLAAQSGLPVFLLGDFNCRSEEWGDSTSSHLANELLDLCSDLQWDILNSIHSYGVVTRPAQYVSLRNKSSSASLHGSIIIDLGISSHPEWVREFTVLQLDDTPLCGPSTSTAASGLESCTCVSLLEPSGQPVMHAS